MSTNKYECNDYTITCGDLDLNGGYTLEVDPLTKLSDEDKLSRKLSNIYVKIRVSAATVEILDELAKIPTVDQVLQVGTGLQLDLLSKNLKLKTVREEGETDSSFRTRLCNEWYNGVIQNNK